MLKKIKDKAGNEILQVLVIVAIIGAVAITVTWMISSKLRSTGKTATEDVGNGITAGVNEFSKDRPTTTP